MADIGGNFVNPAYASPQQIAALREYAKQLLTEQPVRHWAQGVGNIARALVGGYEARKADTEEQAANKEFAKQLMEATSSKDPSKLMAVMASPRAEPLQALLASKLLEWGPAASKEVSETGVRTSAPVEPWFNAGPQPVQPGGPLPPARSSNLTGPDRTSNVVSTADIKPGESPSQAITRTASGVGQTPVPGITPTEQGQLNAFQQRKLQSQQWDTANKENMAAVSKGPTASLRLANIKILKDISDHLDDPAVIAKLKTKATELGLPFGSNTSQYEIFHSVTKRMAYQELQEAANGQRIPPYVLGEFSGANAQLWNDPKARKVLFNKLAQPLDMDMRRANVARRGLGTGADPVSTFIKHSSLSVDPDPLEHPDPTPEAIKALRQDPSKRGEFDAFYGPNRSDDILGD